MHEPLVLLGGVSGYAACAGLIFFADRVRPRWVGVACGLVALAGLLLQGFIWGVAMLMFKAAGMGGSYLMLYLALIASALGTISALRVVLIRLRPPSATG